MSNEKNFGFDRQAARKGVGCSVGNAPVAEEAGKLSQWALEEIEDRPPVKGVLVLTREERDLVCKEARANMAREGRIVPWSNV